MTSKADQAERNVAERVPFAAAVTAKPKLERVAPKPPAALSPWVRPITHYERRETTSVEGLRYG